MVHILKPNMNLKKKNNIAEDGNRFYIYVKIHEILSNFFLIAMCIFGIWLASLYQVVFTWYKRSKSFLYLC